MGQKRLNALSMLSIENPFVHGLVDFNSKVIERFAQAKNRRANFLFKWLALVCQNFFFFLELKDIVFFTKFYLINYASYLSYVSA